MGKKQKIRICPCCGQENDGTSCLFCENCGAELKTQPKRKLGVFLGLGVFALVAVLGVSIVLILRGKSQETAARKEEPVIIQEKEESMTVRKKRIREGKSSESKAVTPDEKESSPEKSSSDSTETVNVEQEVEDIRAIYYGMTMRMEDFTSCESAEGITVYESNKDGRIRCIKAGIGAYSDQGLDISKTYAAEYYYEYDTQEDVYRLRFVFVHNKDYSEEYRIYLTASQKCLRYIGPYESAKTTYDYATPVEDLSFIPVGEFCVKGQLELHLMGLD